MFYQRPLFTRDPPSPTPLRWRVLYVHFRFRMNGRSHPVPIRLPWDHSGSHPVSGVKWQWSVVSDDMSHIDWNCLPRLIDWWQLMISLGTERNDKRKPRNGMEGWGITGPMQNDWLTGCYSNPATEAAMERQKQEGYVNRRKHEPWKNWKIESENWLCLYDNDWDRQLPSPARTSRCHYGE